MELTAGQLWNAVLDAARERVAPHTYKTWLSETRAVALTEDELLVEVPSHFHVEWVGDKYGDQLRELIRQVAGRSLLLSLQCSEDGPAPIPSIGLDESGADHPTSPAGPATPRPRLNERYTFERFVVGNHNQLATAACQAVADKPAKAYNPLFLYGGVGLGKTHLMHAIGNAILVDAPKTRIAYVTSEQFTNELVTAIRRGTTADFRTRYRKNDLLLVDDVHFLEGKERTQEEFFHTFNALYDAQKQIILTSDRPPKEIPGLEARLVSRFEWGLVADVRSPDYETRIAILRKKADDDDLEMDAEVLDLVARSCTSSVRELEGAIIKLLAYSSLTNQEITVPFAQASLAAGVGASSPRLDELTAEHVSQVVAERWNVRAEALSSKRRTKDLTVPRQVAMYLIRELLQVSLARIGKLFGGRDHSTVIHSIRKVESALEAEPDFRRRVESIRDELLRP